MGDFEAKPNTASDSSAPSSVPGWQFGESADPASTQSMLVHSGHSAAPRDASSIAWIFSDVHDDHHGPALPKPKAQKGTPVSTTDAPTIEDVFDPKQPALDGARQDTVLSIIFQEVNDLYEHVLFGQLTELKTELANTPPVPETPFALKLLGWVVETVASASIGYIGGILAKEIFGHEAPQAETTVSLGGTEAEPAVATTEKPAPAPAPDWKQTTLEQAGTLAGSKAGGAIKDKLLRPTSAPGGNEVPTSITTPSLLDEFIMREGHTLLARKSDILARLAILHEHAAGGARPDAVTLGDKLRALIEDPGLSTWFRSKVTMEWLNFVARVSLGPRADGQTTDLIGANIIGGVAGAPAQKQWTTSDGMVEITLNVPASVNGVGGVKLENAAIPASSRASHILQGLRAYTLATIPLYRRVWLKTGDSKLDAAPAFVITPDGSIEADLDNPVLAAIGSGKAIHVGETAYAVGAGRFTDEARKDPAAWSRRAIDAGHCLSGAYLLQGVLSGISSGALK